MARLTYATLTRDPGLDHIRKSLYDRALLDIRCAVDSGQERLARLAFVGMAAWLDTVARLAAPRTNESGADAIRRFVSAYMPEWRGRDRVLYRAFRCALLHEYGTGGVELTRERPDAHGRSDRLSGSVVIDIEALAGELEAAWWRFYDACRTDPALLREVGRRSRGLLTATPVPFAHLGAPQSAREAPATRTYAGTVSASVAGWLLQASPTGAEDPSHGGRAPPNIID